MAKIEFRAKLESVYHVEGGLAYQIIRVPVFTRKHCDMQAFRFHKQYGGLANSDLFPKALARIRRDRFGLSDYNPHIRLDQLPEGVSVDTSGFLALVSIDV